MSIVFGELRLEIRPLDLAAMMKNALEGLTPAIDAKRLKLQSWFDFKAGHGGLGLGLAIVRTTCWSRPDAASVSKFGPEGGPVGKCRGLERALVCQAQVHQKELVF